MNDITQIPTKHNITHLYDLYKAAIRTRNLGGFISEGELSAKREAFKKLFKKITHIKSCSK